MSRSRKLADLLDTNGDVKVGNLDNVVLPNTGLAKSGGAMTGAITTNSTFDGRDVGTDGSKLDGIEASATADQTAAQIKTALENGIDSVHYVNASIDNEHLANDSVTVANLNLISTSSVPSIEARSDGTTDGYIQLNCTANSHGIKLKSPPHSAGASYTLTFPNDDGNNGQKLTTNGSGVLTWTADNATDSSKLPLAGGTLTGAVIGSTDTDASNTGNVTLNFSTKQNFVLTLQGATTLVNPSTETVGQSGFITFIQDGTGGRTVAIGTDYETAGAAGITLSTAANATDIVPYIVVAANRVLLGTPQLAFA